MTLLEQLFALLKGTYDKNMFLIVALNNPGKKYENTPHNIALEVLLKFLKKHNYSLNDFRFEKKFNALILKSKINNKDILFAIPQSFMNLSGEVVSKIKHYYDIENQNIIILQDEIDFSAGKVKIHKNKNHAGHNGIKNIIQHLKTKDFIRIRIGIKTELSKYMNKEKFVLHKFNNDEKTEILKSLELGEKALNLLIQNDFEKAQNIINQE